MTVHTPFVEKSVVAPTPPCHLTAPSPRQEGPKCCCFTDKSKKRFQSSGIRDPRQRVPSNGLCLKLKSPPWWLVALMVAVAYVVLYVWRFIQVNRIESREYVMASELPKECRVGVELYGDPPEKVGVWLMRMDIDGDGQTEWITDAGDYGRGAANSWYEIWKKQADGTFENIGEFYCDEFFVIPRPWIMGHPTLLCVESRGFTEWVRWENGQYEGHGEIEDGPP